MKSGDKKHSAVPREFEIIIYQSVDGKAKLDVRMHGETVWLTQLQMAKLFGRDKSVINRHINNILKEGELDEKVVVANFAITTPHGAMEGKTQNHKVKHYSLDMVLAAGYRVKSPQGTYFRQWATAVLREYLQKGFAMNDEFLKNMGGGVYWKELLERIRDIRASEKVMYRQILDLYATSLDYNATVPETLKFFKIVQNKLHYAVSGHTASEIVFDRANAELPFMGLTVFKGSRPVKSEVTIAKNYMTEKELFALRRMVNAFFDMAELKAETHEPMYMRDWLETLDKFSRDFGVGVLEGAGSVNHIDAVEKAHQEYDTYRAALPDDLTDVEKAYLDTLKDMQKKLKSGGGRE
jgi:hypothetical protein